MGGALYTGLGRPLTGPPHPRGDLPGEAIHHARPLPGASVLRFPRMAHPILLYDGVCGLCNRTVQFVLNRDPDGQFRFAALQSRLAAEILARHGRDAADLDTLVLVLDPGAEAERVFVRSRAILKICGSLGWPWKALLVLWPIPSFLTDLGYRLVARLRYRFFGRYDTCPLPSPEQRSRFLGFEDSEPARSDRV